MPRPSSQLLELAKRGAEYRYRELEAELAALVRQFPHLRAVSTKTNAHESEPTAPVRQRAPRRRRRMSAAARKAVGERMRRYWSERRKAKRATK